MTLQTRSATALLVVLLVLIGGTAHTQTPKPEKLSSDPISAEKIAIYRDFLSHYEEQGQLSNLLGMQPVTVPFKVEKPFGSDRSAYGSGMCLHDIALEPASQAVHRLPPDILAFAEPDSVLRRIKASKTLKHLSGLQKGTGTDGYVLTTFTLSEIVFDATHRYAVLQFSANCHCIGGQGGIVLYKRIRGRWVRFNPDCGHWQG
jgi:hypothetical protein